MTCLVLDSNDNASVADNAGFDIPANTDMLLSIWVKSTETQASGAFIGPHFGHYYIYFNTSLYPRFRVNHTVAGTSDADGTAELTTGEWTHLMGVFDYSANEMALFVNGTRVARTTGMGSGSITDASSDIYQIGATGGSFVGKVSDMYVSTDITGYEPSNATITVPTDYFTADGNTICQHKCDEGSGTTLDNAEGTAALDLEFSAAVNDPSWDASDTPFSVSSPTTELENYKEYIRN